MFNGIIYNIGTVKYLKLNKKSTLIGIQSSFNFKKKDLGTSVSCDGVCLTIFKTSKNMVYFYISKETLNRSNFRFIKINQKINLEKSLVFGQSISGHFCQGHVDSIAKVIDISFEDTTWLIKLKLTDTKFDKFLVEKASIGINGVSLTISKVKKSFFEVNVIPHTLKLTNLKYLKRHSMVNVELDILSKYVYKYSN